MTYRVFNSFVQPGELLADFFPDDRFDESWYSGESFDTPPPNPLELTWDPRNQAGRRLPYYDAGVVLMTKRVFLALQRAGIHNLESYATVIRSKARKSVTSTPPPCEDYLAVNILGSAKVADLEQSVVLDDSEGAMVFESLVVDENRAAGRLFFRLGEAPGTVLIHQSVVERLEAERDLGLAFADPADCVL